MTSDHSALDAAAIERKARLAKLATLKRKQPHTEDDETVPQPSGLASEDLDTDVNKHISGRNYDPETRGPKLGFENAPNDKQETLEARAKALADQAREQEAKEKEEKPLDLFTLQPKKPNWDLKRDLVMKTKALEQRTDNAIAKMVRERIEEETRKEREKTNGNVVTNGGEEEVGIGGADLVKGVHVREREEEDDKRRELEEEEADLI